MIFSSIFHYNNYPLPRSCKAESILDRQQKIKAYIRKQWLFIAKAFG